MYGLLNRSSRPLNTYEFNKVLYNDFFNIIHQHTEKFKEKILFKNVSNKRGKIILELGGLYALSKWKTDNELKYTSMDDLLIKTLVKELGEVEENINKNLNSKIVEVVFYLPEVSMNR